MDAVVLVGGEGTRLRPLTYDLPKQMLPVVDRPMIEHVVAWLGRHGVERVVLSLGYRPDAFVEAFPSGEVDGVRLVYAPEPEPLDTAGAVRFAAEAAGTRGRLLVLNGDVLSDMDVSALIAFHEQQRAKATIQLTPVEDPSRFGVVPTDHDGKVLAFIEKPSPDEAPTNHINAGCYVLEQEVLEGIDPGRRVSIERETFPALVAGGGLYALSSDAYWLDTGTPENYLQASLDVLEGRRTPASRPRAREVEEGIFLGEGAVLEGLVGSPAFIGAGALIEEGATVSASVIGPGAVIAADAEVVGSIVMTGATIGPKTSVEGSIIGPAANVGARSRLGGCSVVRGRTRVADGSVLDSIRYPDA